MKPYKAPKIRAANLAHVKISIGEEWKATSQWKVFQQASFGLILFNYDI